MLLRGLLEDVIAVFVSTGEKRDIEDFMVFEHIMVLWIYRPSLKRSWIVGLLWLHWDRIMIAHTSPLTCWGEGVYFA